MKVKSAIALLAMVAAMVGVGGGKAHQVSSDLMAVSELMRLQGYEGDPTEWLKGYRDERCTYNVEWYTSVLG